MSQVGQTGGSLSTPGLVKKLLKEPKILGTAQIMIGITTFLFGVVLAVSVSTISVLSGVVLWAPVIYITSGVLSLATGNKAPPTVVKGSLTVNVISMVVSGLAIVLLLLSSFGQSTASKIDLMCSEHHFRLGPQEIQGPCVISKRLSDSVNGVLLVFSLLEILVSISSSVFIFRAYYGTEIMVRHCLHCLTLLIIELVFLASYDQGFLGGSEEQSELMLNSFFLLHGFLNNPRTNN
ncbi:membrane-spanning 4-domains subfamily A member 6C-like [Hoplias malabaricus]|uniref:membrane-spanning 4-domains subfamily A member 6C-like n=1 Tax=Hoplias malabaricus TaxID=27720 RepID=UPI0034622ADC